MDEVARRIKLLPDEAFIKMVKDHSMDGKIPRNVCNRIMRGIITRKIMKVYKTENELDEVIKRYE